MSSASRGVRSWPPEEEVTLPKVETMPLLSPTMEIELLKEPWIFPQSQLNATKEEEKTTSSGWEENYQDLSSWCMDTFQGQCDFHIGESTTFKLSGTKYEGNENTSVLSSEEEEVLKDLTSVTDEAKWKVKMNTAGSIEISSSNCHTLESTSVPSSRYGREDDTGKSDASTLSYAKLPRRMSTATSATTTFLSKQNNMADVNSIPDESKYQIRDLDLDDACPTSFDSAESQRETWDVLQTVETNGADTFDLLSYLCDDEIRSPEGSVSTDSSTVSKLWTSVKSPTTVSPILPKVKREKKETTTRKTSESLVSSTVTSTSADASVVSSRRSERMRTNVAKRVEKISYGKVKRGKLGKRRYTEESDSDDDSSISNYRESREKNNEASRKSRMNKKAKETEMATRAIELERDNRILKMKVEELEKLVTSMRGALLRSALKKEF